MYIIAIAWLYVAVLAAAADTTLIGGILTFVFYGVAPLSLVSLAVRYAGPAPSLSPALARRAGGRRRRADQTLGGFSHGQRVKALLVLCLARRPQLLLLDEPTTGLDPVARAEVLESLAEVLRDEHRSVLFSSHNTHDIEQMSDSISFMHQGRLLASADKERFIDEWRRVLCVGDMPEAIDPCPELVQRRAAGSQIELKFRGWQDDYPERLARIGLSVQRIDPMGLEDIFVTTVRAGGLR